MHGLNTLHHINQQRAYEARLDPYETPPEAETPPDHKAEVEPPSYPQRIPGYFSPDGGEVSGVTRWYEIHSLDPAHATGMPPRLIGKFEYLGDALAAIYLEGMEFGQDIPEMTPDDVERRDTHICHHLTIQVVDSGVVTERKTVL